MKTSEAVTTIASILLAFLLGVVLVLSLAGPRIRILETQVNDLQFEINELKKERINASTETEERSSMYEARER